MSRFACRCLLFGVLLATAGCGNDNAPPPTTAPSIVTVTETFAGSINRNGAAIHTFTADHSGSVTVTLTSLAPDTVSAIGLSLGTWNGTACQVVLASTSAAANTSLLGTATTPSNLCVFVNDVGKIANSASYEVTVVHP